MVEWMDMVEMAIQKVCASKVYTSAEFKREKDNFHVNIILAKLSANIELNIIFLPFSHFVKILRGLRQRSG